MDGNGILRPPTQEATILTVYGDIQSGNCYKFRLLLTLLHEPHNWQHIDILRKQLRTPEYLANNRNGKVPLPELDVGRHLAAPNAIINLLAEGTHYCPNDLWLQRVAGIPGYVSMSDSAKQLA